MLFLQISNIEEELQKHKNNFYKERIISRVQAGQQLFNQDPEMAIFWLERSLVLDPEGSNNTKSTYLLSELYSLMRDEKKSIDYLKQSASLGWLQAMEKLGIGYLNGI